MLAVFGLCTAAAIAQPPCGGLIRPAFTFAEYGQQVFFMDSSITHDIAVVRSWDMGYVGGAAGDSTEFTYYFPSDSIYNVCLTLMDTSANGYCQTTLCREVHTDVQGYCTGLIDPSFVLSEGTANTGDFFDSSTTLGTSTVLWEFGDNAIDTNQYAGHTYLWPGRYYVALNHFATDSFGQACRSSAERWVAIDGNGATCNNELFANFSFFSNGSGLWTFDTETITTLAQVGTEVWSFGDETIGLGPFTVHQYANAYTPHQVCMLTAAVDGLQDTCYAYVCHTVDEAATGLPEIADHAALAVWPTPFTDRLFVALARGNADVQLQLTDALGRIVQQTFIPASDIIQWPLAPMPSGIYVLLVQQGSAVHTVRTMHQ